jgi:2-oxoglutarate dehydrogenase E1 component
MELSSRKFSPVAAPEPIAREIAVTAPDKTAYPDFSSGAQALIDAYRLQGYRGASIDPLLDLSPESPLVAGLDPAAYGLAFDESVSYLIHLGGATLTLTLPELLDHLQSIYCGSISLESAHVRAAGQRQWLYAQMEARTASARWATRDSLSAFAKLAAAQGFEQFQRANYPRQKQFSLEGSESFVLLLNTVVEEAARHGVEDVVLGLPHRGRLNMMLNALEVPAKELVSLFSRSPEPSLIASDLKDHAGMSRRIHTAGGDIHVLLAHNPSHLESVSPVVCGMARALQDRKPDGSSKKVMPVLVHGDASFSAQGVVAETLNLSQTRGYGVGGTLHLILNNQVGSTVSHPGDARSTLYCTDTARAIDAPVVHVNADDPDAVVFAGQLASDYRMKFGADIVVDHMSYRRDGHFGGDDPTLTRPAMQRRICGHRSVVELYAEQLLRRGLADEEELDRLRAEALAALTDAHAEQGTSPTASSSQARNRSKTQTDRPIRTSIPMSQLRTLIERLATLPPGFMAHAKIQKMVESWRLVASDLDRPVDWRLAENLSFGSLLVNGFNVRLSGLDIGRGSFLHRQHVWHDQAAETDWQKIHVPLRNVADGQGIFSIFESPLSEEAVLGFEYGYALQCGRDLVVWEAQFGDFVNNAQVIIDQYIASGESKWGYKSGLVLLLPHGHDGAGAEHSCAFLGRFLQLCAAGNLVVAMPSTPAQSYHLLRRQALMEQRKPLIVMTPKPFFYGVEQSYSRLSELADGEFHPLLDDRSAVDRGTVDRAVVTSGKLYYDLIDKRTKAGLQNVAILRAEQLYPFPTDELREVLARFPLLRQVVWAQEEAKNHGAWHLLRDQLEASLPSGATLAYAGRSSSAASAGCDAQQHATEQHHAVANALGIASD